MDSISSHCTALCQGRAELSGKTVTLATTLVLGSAAYGFSVGWWRSPDMAFYVALKLPLLVLLTLAGNAFLNGIFAGVLGSRLDFRETFAACLAGFATFGLIVGSVSPVTFFMAVNAPPPDAAEAAQFHSIFLLSHVVIVGYAGMIAHVKLLSALRERCPSPAIASRTLAAWLAGNLFVGAQLSWNLRPFFGSPNLTVAFLREDPFDGTFYEAVLNSFVRIFLS